MSTAVVVITGVPDGEAGNGEPVERGSGVAWRLSQVHSMSATSSGSPRRPSSCPFSVTKTPPALPTCMAMLSSANHDQLVPASMSPRNAGSPSTVTSSHVRAMISTSTCSRPDGITVAVDVGDGVFVGVNCRTGEAKLTRWVGVAEDGGETGNQRWLAVRILEYELSVRRWAGTLTPKREREIHRELERRRERR